MLSKQRICVDYEVQHNTRVAASEIMTLGLSLSVSENSFVDEGLGSGRVNVSNVEDGRFRFAHYLKLVSVIVRRTSLSCEFQSTDERR